LHQNSSQNIAGIGIESPKYRKTGFGIGNTNSLFVCLLLFLGFFNIKQMVEFFLEGRLALIFTGIGGRSEQEFCGKNNFF
jgi:hypothetical protein